MCELVIEVKGPLACFTNLQMKGERFSYDVITPSAGVGIFESILWKPEIEWWITRIEVLSPIIHDTLMTNEVGFKAKASKLESFFVQDHRVQRLTRLLRNVHYRLSARLIDKSGNPIKYIDMLKRRAKNGQCYRQPCLGLREFAADFRWVDGEGTIKPIPVSKDLGLMLHSFNWKNGREPRFWHAYMNNGVILVPPVNSNEVVCATN